LAEERHPDVVLLDLRMKDSHGLDAVAAAPALNSSCATIVAISFSDDDDAKTLAKQIGGNPPFVTPNVTTALKCADYCSTEIWETA
jgi:DNA-binding response OmpR family regulator